jgi:hypothetical protein
MYFYCVEATLSNTFDDPVGPADSGWLAMPCLALCAIEAAPTTSTMLRASDVGYRTRATDPGGVVAYKPFVVEAFKVDVAANLDPTKTAVAGAWGTLTFNNLDNSLDATVAAWNSDGQVVRVLRGQKTLDATRNIFVDPPYASLVQVFVGVMGPWQVTSTTVEVALRDATYYLERQVPRNLYGGTGGLDGEVGLQGLPKPMGIGGNFGGLKNVTPVLVDAANLIYQVNDGPVSAITVVSDGGYAGIVASGDVANLYSGSTTAGHYRTSLALGLLQLGSIPTFNLTVTFSVVLSGAKSIQQLAREALLLMTVPLANISSADGINLDTLGANAAAVARAAGSFNSQYLSTGDQMDGPTLLSRLLEAVGAYLVPGKDGKLRMLVVTTIPGGATPVLSLDDTTIVTIDPDNLPDTIDPPPWRIRLAWDRNWTVMTSGLAGATPASTVTWLAAGFRTVSAGASAVALLQVTRPSDPPVIGQDGSLSDFVVGGTNIQLVANDLISLWGLKRRLYSIVIPHFLADVVDWGSIVKVTSSFDGLNAGKLGQIVGWSYASGDATVTLKVLV